jgi:hypothetical protein
MDGDPSACSLASNNLTNFGQDIRGVIKLAEVLSSTEIEQLK